MQKHRLVDVNYGSFEEKDVFHRLTRINLKDPKMIIIFVALSPTWLSGLLIAGGVISSDYLILTFHPLLLMLYVVVIQMARKYYADDVGMSYRNFATLNGWEHHSTQELSSLVPPSVTKHYHKFGRAQVHVISVDLVECQFELVHMQLSGTDDHEGSTVERTLLTVARYRLPGVMPQVILDNKKITTYSTTFNRGLAETALEGNFSNSFRFLHNKNDQVNALSVITPEVMAIVQDLRSDYEIEIVGEYLYFFSFYDLADPVSMRELFHAMVRIAPEIAHKAKTMRL